MIGELQETFGGNPDRWLAIPLPVFRCYLRMLPRVRAGRELELHRALSSVHMKPAERRRYRGQLERQMRGGRREKAVSATAADLAAIGIQHEEVTT